MGGGKIQECHKILLMGTLNRDDNSSINKQHGATYKLRNQHFVELSGLLKVANLLDHDPRTRKRI